MSEQKHTPGPWYKAVAVTKGIDNYIEIAIFSDAQVHPYRTVAKIISPLESIALANAELIARAPELLQQVAELTKENGRINELRKTADRQADQAVTLMNYANEKVVALTEQVEKLKEGIDTALVILVKPCTEEEQKICYDHLDNIRYGNKPYNRTVTKRK